MTELRWLIDNVVDDCGDVVEVRVLQYRNWLPQNAGGARWTDWKDVPTVREE